MTLSFQHYFPQGPTVCLGCVLVCEETGLRDGDHCCTIVCAEGPRSFTGSPAKKVYARCKEDILCYVLGRGWNNHNGMFIIEQVITVEEVPVD